MISKAKLKLVRSLEQKKYRKQEGLFVAEGPKVVGDLLAVMPAREVFATRQWVEQNAHSYPTTPLTEISDEELRKLLSGHLCRCTGYENIFRAVKKTMYRRLGKEIDF